MIDALLDRIGVPARPDATVDGLHTLHRAFLARVPYEDIAVQLGETGALDEASLMTRVCTDGRGGYCFELNTVLAALLRACGFVVTHHQAVVGGDGPTNHMTLLVHMDDGSRWLADAGLGEGFVEPLPFQPGTFEIGPLTYSLADGGDGTWWMGQHEWSSFSGFRMELEPSSVADFEVHHHRQAFSPESNFIKTFVAQSPRQDRIVTLRARTLSSIGPAVNERRVLEREEFAPTLLDVFGITLAGERVERLWTQAVAQHEAFLSRPTT